MSRWVNWVVIFRDAVPAVAGVTVYDKGAADGLGRYMVCKTMTLRCGRRISRSSYYRQRPAAIRYARKFLVLRAALVGGTYSPGDGEKTWMYKPVNAGVEK